jgi:hypothetical protein
MTKVRDANLYHQSRELLVVCYSAIVTVYRIHVVASVYQTCIRDMRLHMYFSFEEIEIGTGQRT